MNYGRGSPIAQKNDIVQNGDSWFSLTPPGKLVLPRSAPVPVDMPGNQRIGTWQDLLGMYSEILNHDVAIQTPNPSSVTSINRTDFDLFDVVTEADQHLDRNADAYVQNFSNDSAGSCNNRAAEVIGIRTKENYVLSSGQRNNGQISIRRTDSNTCTEVAGNWRELESTSLMPDRQHSLRRTDSNSSTQVASNWTELEATSSMLDRHMKTPSQLEALEKTLTATKYPTLAEMDELAMKLGLLESQVRMWFYHRRMKYKKESSRKKPPKVLMRKKRMICYSSSDESESESESDEFAEISPDESGEPSNAAALTEHRGRSGNSSDGRIVERSRLKKIKLEYPPPEEAQSLLSRSLLKSACVESHVLVHSQKASEEIETSKKGLSNLEAELDDVQKKVHSAKKEVKDLKSRLVKDDVIAAWRSEVTALKAELDAAEVEKDSAAKLFEEKLNAKNQELEDLHRQLETERAWHKEEKDEAYARFGNDVVALIRKFKAAA